MAKQKHLCVLCGWARIKGYLDQVGNFVCNPCIRREEKAHG